MDDSEQNASKQPLKSSSHEEVAVRDGVQLITIFHSLLPDDRVKLLRFAKMLSSQTGTPR